METPTPNIAKLVLAPPEGQIGKPLKVNSASSPASGLRRTDWLQRNDLLASGGMGLVYLAEDLNCRRTVAMKVLGPGQADDREKRLRFIIEAQITAQLEHPNIVPVHNLGTDAEGNIYYTMKRIAGSTLQSVLTALRNGDRATIQQWPLSRLLTVLDKVCDAVAFAHSRGVLHRDLKPDNIMLGDYGEVLVMDWGIAIIQGDKQQPAQVRCVRQDLSELDPIHTLDGVVVGTPAYMSPEQASGEVSSLSSRSDIYSLGAILYTILTLRGPIEPGPVEEMLAQICTGKILSPMAWNTPSDCQATTTTRRKRLLSASELSACASASLQRAQLPEALPHLPNGQVPEALSAVCMKALAREPKSRYVTVQKLQEDLQAWREGFATHAEAAGVLRQLSLLVCRHKAEAVLLSTALVTVMGLTVGFMIKLSISEDRAIAALHSAEAHFNGLKAEQVERRRITREALPAFLELADKRLKLHLWEEALHMTQVAVSLEPELAKPHVLAGRALMALYRFPEATAAFSHAMAKSVARTEADSYIVISRQAEQLMEQHGATGSNPEVRKPAGEALRQMGDSLVGDWLLGKR